MNDELLHKVVVLEKTIHVQLEDERQRAADWVAREIAGLERDLIAYRNRLQDREAGWLVAAEARMCQRWQLREERECRRLEEFFRFARAAMPGRLDQNLRSLIPDIKLDKVDDHQDGQS